MRRKGGKQHKRGLAEAARPEEQQRTDQANEAGATGRGGGRGGGRTEETA